MIGNTPLIKIKYKFEGAEEYIYAKVEYYNLTGSIKDRMAEYILSKAIKDGLLLDNQPIIEATSGNTGISLAALGAKYKHDVHIFMPDWVSIERRKIMEMYGAKIILVDKEEGGFKKAIELADQLAIEINGFRPNQFSNKYNVEAHYNTTAQEIIESIDNVDGFVSGIGTGGTLIGVGKRLKEAHNSKVYALEPVGLPILSAGITEGSHEIEGIGDDFIPEIVDKTLIDEIIIIDDVEAVNMAQKSAKELGLGIGISSGANLLASILAKTKNKGNIVTIFVDDNKKYLSTKLSEEIGSDLISNDIELISYEVIKKDI